LKPVLAVLEDLIQMVLVEMVVKDAMAHSQLLMVEEL